MSWTLSAGDFVRVERRKEADLHRTFIFATFEPYVHPLTEAELNELLGMGGTVIEVAFDQ